MTLKKAILEVMDRDDLKVVIDDFELECTDRRSREEMEGLISRSRRVGPGDLLQYLSESQVKQVCERLGIDGTGRRGQLIHRLLGTEPKTPKSSSGVRRKRAEDEPNSIDATSDTIPEVPVAPLVRLPDAPPGMLRVTKTELVWPGKYNEDGTRKEVPRVNLPFQVIESINRSRASREARKRGIQGTLFDVYEGNEGSSFDAGWANKLIWGDNLLVMGSLLKNFSGKIELIYIDPPFATGTDFSFVTEVGDSGEDLHRAQTVIEEKAYRDTWGRGLASYLAMIRDRFVLMHELLSDNGSIFVHLDETVMHYVKIVLDDVFGERAFRNDIVCRSTFSHADANQFGSVHQNVLFYSKTQNYKFSPVYVPYEADYIDKYYRYKDPDGRRWLSCSLTGAGASGGQFKWRGLSPPPGRHWAHTSDRLDELDANGKIYWTKNGIPRLKQYLDEMQGMPAPDVWWDKECQPLLTWTDEAVSYATQKPESLLRRIVNATTSKGDLVADFFCGSGTCLTVAEKLQRRWIGCDLGRWAIHVTRKRLLGIEECKPFEVLNLGKYERQYWQGVTFGAAAAANSLTEQAIYEYFAFILKLYGAQPVAGMTHLHGKKGKALLHIGAVDSPVTISDIDLAVDECSRLKQGELQVLGWEWEMGLHDLMVEAAKKKGVKLLLLQIPREVMEQQAAAKGDVRFFELAYLEAEITQPKKLAARVTLQDFVIQNSDLIPDEVRSKVKKWSDYIDYWAIDWDFQNDTFLQGWVAYRTRKERSLPLESDPHTYPKAGKYRILVKVIDIFGNDTSQAFDVEIKG
jgi:adenine-specific DNA-methyltransferase